MSANEQLNVFLNPKSVAVIEATERPGSWGVALTDALGAEGLRVPELSAGLQSGMRELGMPIRASVKNPVDIGASGLFFDKQPLRSDDRERDGHHAKG